MRVVYLAAGAAGMICGSCIRDNRLAAALRARGRDITLIPLYTPLRTDGPGAAEPVVYYGGLNVVLAQRAPRLGRLPRPVRRLLDSPTLLRGLGRFAGRTEPADVGPLTVSILRGPDGAQRRELDELIAALRTLRPDVVNLPNLMFAGIAGPLRAALGAAVVCTLGGEDVFLDRLTEPWRAEAFGLIRAAAGGIDGYIAMNHAYADHCATHFGLPRERIDVAPLGVAVDGPPRTTEPPSPPLTIAYLARVCPDKGFHVACQAYATLRARGHDCRLVAAGYLRTGDRGYFDAAVAALRADGWHGGFAYRGAVSQAGKRELLAGAHLFTMPSVFPEAKGLPVLEALAAGVPVVLPRAGAFPELVAQTGGGILYDPGQPDALADALERLALDGPQRRALAAAGGAVVRAKFTDAEMAERTWRIYERHASQRQSGRGG